MRLLVTGGCGFIGSNFIRYVLEHYQPEMITNVDALSYPVLCNRRPIFTPSLETATSSSAQILRTSEE